MSKPVIAVDIDDVLFPFMGTLLSHSNKVYNLNHSLDEITDFDLGFWNVSNEEAVNRVHEVVRLDHREVDALPGAQESIERLRQKFRILILTSRDEEFRSRTEEWLDHHFAGLYDDVILSGNKYTGKPYRRKAAVCQENDVVLLIDDQLQYARESSEAGLGCILFGNYSWNQAATVPENVVRANDWAQVETILMDGTDATDR